MYRGRKGHDMASYASSVADNSDLLVSLLEKNYRAELLFNRFLKGEKRIVFEALYFFLLLFYLKNPSYCYSFLHHGCENCSIMSAFSVCFLILKNRSE